MMIPDLVLINRAENDHLDQISGQQTVNVDMGAMGNDEL